MTPNREAVGRPMNLKLPEEFGVEFQEGDRLILGWTEDGQRNGCVTIDFATRRYRVGYSEIGFLERVEKVYAGRGWREALVADAVKALKSSPY